MTKSCPAMLRLPERATGAAFDATVKPTVPLPVPLVPESIVIHSFVVEAFHRHPAGMATVTRPVSEAKPWLEMGGENVGVQGAPSCETINAIPLRRIAPVRSALLELGCAR